MIEPDRIEKTRIRNKMKKVDTWTESEGHYRDPLRHSDFSTRSMRGAVRHPIQGGTAILREVQCRQRLRTPCRKCFC